MTREEIIELMDKPKQAALIPYYRNVYIIAAGKPWKTCMCGNGFENFYRVCKNYAEALKREIANETTIITE